MIDKQEALRIIQEVDYRNANGYELSKLEMVAYEKLKELIEGKNNG